jgi:hypothetical protein
MLSRLSLLSSSPLLLLPRLKVLLSPPLLLLSPLL